MGSVLLTLASQTPPATSVLLSVVGQSFLNIDDAYADFTVVDRGRVESFGHQSMPLSSLRCSSGVHQGCLRVGVAYVAAGVPEWECMDSLESPSHSHLPRCPHAVLPEAPLASESPTHLSVILNEFDPERVSSQSPDLLRSEDPGADRSESPEMSPGYASRASPDRAIRAVAQGECPERLWSGCPDRDRSG